MNSSTSAIGKLKAHFANWRRWELNPIVVKELRQAVRSWSVTGMLLLFLAVLFCTALIVLVTQTLEFSTNTRLGAEIFQIFSGILTGASLIFIPLYVGIRLAAERQDSNLDLLYITTLTPARIIRGKFLCGAYMTVLFFSACMPFMAFTNLLRGVDLPTVAFILIYLFSVICVVNQVAIFIACLPISKWFKILLGLAGLVTAFPITSGLIFSFYSLMQSGVGSMMAGTMFWSVFFTVSGIVLAVVVLLYFLSVALISPPSANRGLPVKTYLTVIWVIGAIISLAWMVKTHETAPAVVWCVITMILMCGSLIVVVSNQDQLSLRVRRSIPANAVGRLLAFLFYNGAAGGLVWVTFISFATYFLTMLAVKWIPSVLPAYKSIPNRTEFQWMMCGTILYAMAYALTALFIHRKFLSRRPPKLAGIFTILLPALWALIPNIVLFFGNRLSFRSLEATQLGNVFNLYMTKTPEQQIAHIACASLWLVVVVVLNFSWFIRQLREFRPLGSAGPTVRVEPSVPPRIPAEPTVS